MVLLGRLITILGVYETRVVGERPAEDAMIRSVGMHDPASELLDKGDILLAVGVSDAERAVELAVEAGALAVVVRTGEKADPPWPAVDLARRHGIVLLVVDPAVSWGQITGIVHGMVLEGGETEAGRGPSDMPTLADTMAERVGGPITVEDARSRVLTYSAKQTSADRARLDTILGRRVPEPLQRHLRETGVTTHLATSDSPVFVPPSEEHGMGGRTAIAIRIGREFLGSLWLVCDQPPTTERTRRLSEGARTFALHLLRTRVSTDLERQVESDLVGRLLEGGMDPTEAAGRLGLAADSYRVIALQAHTPEERHSATLMAFEQATTGFGWTRPGRSTVFGSTVYTVLPCEADPAPARDWLAEIVRGLPEHVVIHAGIGGPAVPARLPDSRREADESLTLQASRPGRPAVAYDESWDEVLLHRLRMASSSGRRPADGPVADLIRHDTEHGTHFAATLRAWLRSQGDPAGAAELLAVHPNTVRNRIRRMGEHTRLGLDDPQMRLALAIALEIYVQDDRNH